MMFLALLISVTSGCSSVGGLCQSNSDCCPDICSPTSCMQGRCIGSICLTNGYSCQVDCQCCSGTCIQNDVNPGTCGVPSLKKGKPWPFANTSAHVLCEGASCGPGGCSGDGTCSVCCPPGQAAHCEWDACHCYCSTNGEKVSKLVTTSSQNVTIILSSIIIGLLVIVIVLGIFIAYRIGRRNVEQVPLIN